VKLFLILVAFSSVKEQAFDFMWDEINWKKGVNILLTNNR
jgi:hypothetical protein